MAEPPSQAARADEFMKEFGKKKAEVADSIKALSPSLNQVENGSKLSEILKEIQQMNKSLHDASFLPSYSKKMRQDELRALELLLKEKENEIIPKKAFGFSFSAKPTPKPVPEPAEEKPALENVDGNGNDPIIVIEADDSNHVTVENLENTSVIVERSKLEKNDVLIRNLNNVVLHLEGSPSTLRINNVKNSKILCGPVYTSVFVESVKDSVLFLCCQQLRTHNSNNTDIYLSVRSRAIIEDCAGIRFAPYHWDHPLSAELHQETQMDPTLERFDAVDDFNWLSSEPSPHWKILPEEERVSFPPPVIQ